MATKDDDLLDSIIAGTLAEAEGPLRPPPPPQADPDLRPTDHELRGPQRWAHDPDVRDHIAGLRRGHAFEMRDCGPDLDGQWEVVKLDLNHPDINQRYLTAQRPTGGPPYIKMTELDFLDEIREGRVVVGQKG